MQRVNKFKSIMIIIALIISISAGSAYENNDTFDNGDSNGWANKWYASSPNDVTFADWNMHSDGADYSTAWKGVNLSLAPGNAWNVSIRGNSTDALSYFVVSFTDSTSGSSFYKDIRIDIKDNGDQVLMKTNSTNSRICNGVTISTNVAYDFRIESYGNGSLTLFKNNVYACDWDYGFVPTYDIMVLMSSRAGANLDAIYVMYDTGGGAPPAGDNATSTLNYGLTYNAQEFENVSSTINVTMNFTNYYLRQHDIRPYLIYNDQLIENYSSFSFKEGFNGTANYTFNILPPFIDHNETDISFYLNVSIFVFDDPDTAASVAINDNTVDGNYGNNADIDYVNYLNFSVPAGSERAIWDAKYTDNAGSPKEYNITIPDNCFNVSNQINLKFNGSDQPGFDYVQFYCYNGSDYQFIYSEQTSLLRVYEVGVLRFGSGTMTKNNTGQHTILLNPDLHHYNITAYSNTEAAAILNYSLTITSLDGSETASYNTLNGSILSILSARAHNVTISAGGYADNYGSSVILNSTFINHQFDLYTKDSFNISFKDESSLALIDTATITLDLISDPFSNRYNTTNGTIYIDLLTPATYTFRYSAPGYQPRISSYTLTADTYNEITLWLLTGGANVSLYVYDQKGETVQGATIKIYRYSAISNSYFLINSVDTDFTGSAVTNLELNSEFYKFYIYYEGELKKQTTGAYITGTELTFEINTEQPIAQKYYEIQGVTGYVSFNEATNNFRYYFNDPAGVVSQGCLKVRKVSIAQETLFNQTCVSGSSALILITATNISGQTYSATGYITIEGTEYFFDHFSYTFAQDSNYGNMGIFIVFMLTIVAGFMMIWDIAISLILLPLPTLIGSLPAFRWINLPPEYALGLEVIMIVLAFIIKRRGY